MHALTPLSQLSMSRYLTPSKIGLLVLTSLYTESAVPSAAVVPILSFLVCHVFAMSSIAFPNCTNFRLHDSAITIDDFQKSTFGHASVIPGRSIWDLLLNKLWELDSLDALHVFFDTLSLLLQKTDEEIERNPSDGSECKAGRMLLSRVSPLGSFVRRAQLEFTRLQFHEGASLWKSFISYRASTMVQWRRRNVAAGTTSFDVNLQSGVMHGNGRLIDTIYGDLANECGKEASISTEDVEKLLEYQVDKMQSTCS